MKALASSMQRQLNATPSPSKVECEMDVASPQPRSSSHLSMAFSPPSWLKRRGGINTRTTMGKVSCSIYACGVERLSIWEQMQNIESHWKAVVHKCFA